MRVPPGRWCSLQLHRSKSPAAISDMFALHQFGWLRPALRVVNVIMRRTMEIKKPDMSRAVEGNRRAFRDAGLTTLDVNFMAGLMRFPEKSVAEVGRIVGGWCRQVSQRRAVKLEQHGYLARFHKARVWAKSKILSILESGCAARKLSTFKRMADKVRNALKVKRNRECVTPSVSHTKPICLEGVSEGSSDGASLDLVAIALENARDWDGLARYYEGQNKTKPFGNA
mgnify:CR=1 FL=1